MAKTEELEMDAHREQIKSDIKGLVHKYRTLFGWDVPEVSDVKIDASAAPASTPASWLPAADSASAPTPVATLPPTGERSNRALSREQESSSTPMAGQNNDHSAPLTQAKPASGP